MALCDVNVGRTVRGTRETGASDHPREENPGKEECNGEVHMIADMRAARGAWGQGEVSTQMDTHPAPHGVWPGKGSTALQGGAGRAAQIHAQGL